MPEKPNRSREKVSEEFEVEGTLDKDFLDIADLKEMNISKLTQIAKELMCPAPPACASRN
jgi:hypothetical protein